MRFMLLVKATSDSEAGVLPSTELVAAMQKYNEELVKAGVLLDANGLMPSSGAIRISYPEAGGQPVVTDGPFTEAKEMIAGYTLIEVKSREEAIEWAKRMPDPHGFGQGQVELRQVYDIEAVIEDTVQAARDREIQRQAEEQKKA